MSEPNGAWVQSGTVLPGGEPSSGADSLESPPLLTAKSASMVLMMPSCAASDSVGPPVLTTPPRTSLSLAATCLSVSGMVQGGLISGVSVVGANALFGVPSCDGRFEIWTKGGKNEGQSGKSSPMTPGLYLSRVPKTRLCYSIANPLGSHNHKGTAYFV